jgi:protein DGCR14
MYGPSGAIMTYGDLPPNEKSISHANTRILKASSSQVINDASEASKRAAREAWSSVAAATPSLFKAASNSPRVQGYGFVAATPSPTPHQDIDPTELMTWGMIEGSRCLN